MTTASSSRSATRPAGSTSVTIAPGTDGTPATPALAKARAEGKFFRSMTHYVTPTGIYAADSLREVWTISGHKGDLSGLDFSPDGKFLASAGAEEVFLWEVDTGKEL